MSTSSLHSPRIIERGHLRSVKTYLSPIDETLWAQLQEAQETLDSLDAIYHPPLPHATRIVADTGHESLRLERELIVSVDLDRRQGCLDPEACVLLQSCFESLRLARDCIEKRKRWWRVFLENIQLFWRLVHRIDEDVLLLLPLSGLAARAIDVQDTVERNTIPQAREPWLGADSKRGALTNAVNEILNDATPPTGDVSGATPVAPAPEPTATTNAWSSPEPYSSPLSPYRHLQRQRQVLRQALQATNQRND